MKLMRTIRALLTGKVFSYAVLRALALVGAIGFAASEAEAEIVSGAKVAFTVSGSETAYGWYTLTVKSKATSTSSDSQTLSFDVYNTTTSGATSGGTKVTSSTAKVYPKYSTANTEVSATSSAILQPGNYYCSFTSSSALEITITGVSAALKDKLELTWKNGSATDGDWSTSASWYYPIQLSQSFRAIQSRLMA